MLKEETSKHLPSFLPEGTRANRVFWPLLSNGEESRGKKKKRSCRVSDNQAMTNMHTLINTHTRIRTLAHARTHTQMFTHIHKCLHTFTHKFTHTHTHTHIHTQILSCTHKHKHIHIHTHTHTHTRECEIMCMNSIRMGTRDGGGVV